MASIAILFSASSVAFAEPPGRGAERGVHAGRPLLVDSWRNVQQHVRRDFLEAKDNVRRDFQHVRENVQRESSRVRQEVERRRPREFQFVHILDALFGRPAARQEVQSPNAQNGQWQQDRGYYDNYNAPPPRVADQWEREDEWAERFEDQQRTKPLRAEPRQQQRERYRRDRSGDKRRSPVRQRQREQVIESIPDIEPETPVIRQKQRAAKSTPKKKLETKPQTTLIDKPKRSEKKEKPLKSTIPSKRSERKADLPPPPATDAIPTHDDLQPPKTDSKPEPKIAKKDSYPYGLPVPGKAGMVYSPHVNDSGKYVDVRNIPAGTLVKDPYSDKFFKVP